MADEDLPLDGGEGDIDAPIAEPEAPDTPQPEDDGPSLADLAGEMGWKPKEQWKGDPEKWKPAHEFVRTTVDVNRNLTTRLKGFEERMDVLVRTHAVATEQALADQRAKLLAERDEAWSADDRDAYNQANEKLKVVEAKEQQIYGEPPEVTAFRERNAWYGKNEEASNWAYARCGELGQMKLSHARQLAIVEREAKTLFPELFPEDKPAAKPAPLNNPGNRGAAPVRKGYSSLPAEAQAAAQNFVKSGVFENLEEYAQVYYEQGMA